MSTYTLGQRRWRALLAALLVAANLIAAGIVAEQTDPFADANALPHLAGPHDDFGG